jgi:hypothetical protein
MNVNWKESGKKLSWPYLRHYQIIRLKKPRTAGVTAEIQTSHFPNTNLLNYRYTTPLDGGTLKMRHAGRSPFQKYYVLSGM